MATGLSTAPERRSLSRGMPLFVQLPLLVLALLVVVLAVVVLATWRALHQSATELADERIERAARQIAAISATSVAGRQPRYTAVARDTIIRAALRGANLPAGVIEQSLAGAAVAGDSALPLELWSASGRLLAVHGDSTPRPAARELPSYVVSAMRGVGTAGGDSLRSSAMYPDGHRVVLWFVQPIRVGGRLEGYIAHKRRLTAGPITAAVLRELSGMPVSLYYRNADGSLWATAAGEHVAAVGGDPRGSSESLLVREERIGASDVLIRLQLETTAILGPTRRIVGNIVMLGVILTALGAVIAWRLTRRLTGPLAELTAAVRTIAHGNYGVRVEEHGSAEVRYLGAMFNDMTAEIERGRASLKEQTERAETASRAKSEFLATMSHELRTPLNAIGGYAELLEMGLRGPLNEEQRRDLQRIRLSQRHLLGLISQVLDLARVEAGTIRYNPEPLPLAPLLRDLVDLVSPLAAAKGVALQCEPCPPDLGIVADPEKVRQILLNLLSNAIRHTPPGGEVRIAAEPSASDVRLTVADDGPGIPPDKRDAIFEPFVQLDRSLSIQRDGLGIGLSISRDLAVGMGGSLALAPRSEPGACFVLTLPRASLDPVPEMRRSA